MMHDILRARRILQGHLEPTPLLAYPALDELTGCQVWVKHENLQPTGAFKVRGGLTLLAGMDQADRARGVLGYSTGNHAQSLAWAAARHGAPCTIVMPERPNPVKARAVLALGAELIEHGATFDQAKPYAERLAAERGMRLVSVADEPDLIAGVGTLYLELVEQRPDVEVIIVPVGSGSGAAAACLVTAALNPSCRVIAVQSAGSPAAHDSWRVGECVTRPNTTTADGLATGTGFDMPQRVLREHLADFVLVSDEQIRTAQWLLMREARTLAEAAGAAPLAALLHLGDALRGRRVALVCTGGNSSETELRACVPGLAASSIPAGRYAAAENTGR